MTQITGDAAFDPHRLVLAEIARPDKTQKMQVAESRPCPYVETHHSCGIVTWEAKSKPNWDVLLLPVRRQRFVGEMAEDEPGREDTARPHDTHLALRLAVADHDREGRRVDRNQQPSFARATPAI